MMNEEIKKALEDGVDLPEAEYMARAEAADRTTEAHGVAGDAPISEEQRHKRIQSNFYGTALNIMLSLYSAAEEILMILREKEGGNAHGGD